jgi:hypothetical protein
MQTPAKCKKTKHNRYARTPFVTRVTHRAAFSAYGLPCGEDFHHNQSSLFAIHLETGADAAAPIIRWHLP